MKNFYITTLSVIRHRKRLTQEKFARLLGITQTTVSYYESGRLNRKHTRLKDDIVDKMVQVLDWKGFPEDLFKVYPGEEVLKSREEEFKELHERQRQIQCQIAKENLNRNSAAIQNSDL